MSELIIDIEVCKDCHAHTWFTSHKSEKYEANFSASNIHFNS